MLNPSLVVRYRTGGASIVDVILRAQQKVASLERIGAWGGLGTALRRSAKNPGLEGPRWRVPEPSWTNGMCEARLLSPHYRAIVSLLLRPQRTLFTLLGMTNILKCPRCERLVARQLAGQSEVAEDCVGGGFSQRRRRSANDVYFGNVSWAEIQAHALVVLVDCLCVRAFRDAPLLVPQSSAAQTASS
jgi:hypothetical protein